MEQNAYNIAFAVNDGYVMPLCVALQSISVHSRSRFNIHILYTSLSDASREVILGVCENTSLTCYFHNVSLHIPNHIAKGHYGRQGVESMIRFVLPMVIEAKVVLYLDCDIIANDDVAEIFHRYQSILLTEQLAAAVVEDCTSEVQIGRDTRFSSPYFNSGVMLINLDYWRSELITMLAFQYAFHEPQLPHHDQDILNIMLNGKVCYLPWKYNAQNGFYWKDKAGVGMLLIKPVIVHFTGPHKPWKPTCQNPWRVRWLQLYRYTFGEDFKHSRNPIHAIARLWYKYSPFVKYKELYISLN